MSFTVEDFQANPAIIDFAMDDWFMDMAEKQYQAMCKAGHRFVKIHDHLYVIIYDYVADGSDAEQVVMLAEAYGAEFSRRGVYGIIWEYIAEMIIDDVPELEYVLQQAGENPEISLIGCDSPFAERVVVYQILHQYGPEIFDVTVPETPQE